ncbi:MAG: response regulator transcription factor [Hymenobacteraceae bacterium]|nr:response regulator transcription factor [Hymenobacteraceae bacterium]MDX5395414.1 response regulator transcription factor [Hymenobacteraceae bacterium]MDX5443012.1 response regulator transcription factor [Hymenobacteraceae bacterium]MDX5511463.1 response regulator transcription factor [Hymenobacteraceae bacterium]
MIKVVLVDDHRIIRKGISALFDRESGIEVIGDASNGKELVVLLEQKVPDVVLLDIHLPEMDGLQTTKYLKDNYPEVNVLVLTTDDDESYVYKFLKAGAMGYILKNVDKEELVFAVQTVARNRNYLCTEISLNLLEKVCSKTSFRRKFQERSNGEFSKREMEVLLLIAEGYTNAEIAEKLFTSRRTIETHRQHLLDKTQAKNTAALISYAFTKGVIK